MVELLVLANLLIRRLPWGRQLDTFAKSKGFVEDTVEGMRPPHIEREIELAEEGQFPGVFFPVQISDETLRCEGACQFIESKLSVPIRGEYVFTLREWRELQEWLRFVVGNRWGLKKESLNGEGLLHLGRKRWASSNTQTEARENAAAHTSMWLSRGMWPQ